MKKPYIVWLDVDNDDISQIRTYAKTRIRTIRVIDNKGRERSFSISHEYISGLERKVSALEKELARRTPRCYHPHDCVATPVDRLAEAEALERLALSSQLAAAYIRSVLEQDETTRAYIAEDVRALKHKMEEES